MSRLAFVLALLLSQVLVAWPAVAQPKILCMDRASMHTMLKNNFNEDPVVSAVTDQGALVELFMNEETRTWTEVISIPGKLSCLFLVGDGFRYHKEEGREIVR